MASAPDQQIEASVYSNVELTSSTDPQVVTAGVEGKSLFISAISISTDTEQSVKIISDGGEILVANKYLPASSVWSKSFIIPVSAMVRGEGVKVVCSTDSGNVTVDLEGYYR